MLVRFMVWEAFKATRRGHVIAYKAKLAKESKVNILELQAVDITQTAFERARLEERGRIEEQYLAAKENTRDFFMWEESSSARTFQQQLHEENWLNGRFLALSTQVRHNSQRITNILNPVSNLVMSRDKDIAQVFLRQYRPLYQEACAILIN
ncbi:hypothetical protein NDU88_007307 [Pleurodeles waltl]|uniref:Uncharacterized protein n=1 Tax=Pleurodeles waltl TaxID=8319 RepID=A0AAV7SSC2_PLEWA|nr:hypothetical protein NDU88_007307 [Pleurodeles waltl]